MYLVYKVVLGSNIKYIGVTSKKLETRKKDHFYEAFKRNSSYVFHRAIRKYKEELVFEILDTANCWQSAQIKEIMYIACHKTHVKHGGYNSTLGGEGVSGIVISAEARRKSSESRKGKKSTRVGYKHSKETLEKMRQANLGKSRPSRWTSVIDNDGVVYKSINEASKLTNIKATTIRESARLNRALKNGKSFKYFKEVT
jgi:hypothetical protein